jgi:outer membrane protein OmpA-like peptidoglycan-associated protein
MGENDRAGRRHARAAAPSVDRDRQAEEMHAQPASDHPADRGLLNLQRSLGNRAVIQLLAGRGARGADALTHGNHIFDGSARRPTPDLLTAHEPGHVTQQRGSTHAAEPTLKRVQRSTTGSFPVANGIFEIDWQTRQGKTDASNPHIGLDGYMRFLPNVGTPNSNNIVFTQIAKLTDLKGTDVDAGTDAGPQAPRGALGTPGIRTADDALRGVEGGFSTDATHATGAGPVPAGSALSPDYDVSPAAPGTVGPQGKTAQPAIRGGGVGLQFRQDTGFKRSDDPADMDSVAMYDIPGTTSTTANLKFDFESVVRGVDTEFTYGVVKWGFQIVDGVVGSEYLNALDGASATFEEALNRHMDFYVHEPMTFYFEFNKDQVTATEEAKIDHLLPYLARNPKATMALTGEADIRGGASRYNLDLSLRRAEAVKAAMIAKGIPEKAFDSITLGQGASTSATTNAGTGDMGGDPAVGADQDREANRWANRRVTVTFTNPKGP